MRLFVQVLFRNPLSEIVKLLQMKHNGCYKVYNLCSEHVYSPEKIGGVFGHFPFEDHQVTQGANEMSVTLLCCLCGQ